MWAQYDNKVNDIKNIGSDMDFVKKRLKYSVNICKCFMNMLINGVQTATIFLFLNQ